MFGKPLHSTPEAYIASLDEPRRTEIQRCYDLVAETCPELPITMDFAMIGFGPYHYKYATGREGDWMRIGLASNKAYISLYVCVANQFGYVAERYKDRLPKASIGKSCVRFKKLDDLDVIALKELLREGATGSVSVG